MRGVSEDGERVERLSSTGSTIHTKSCRMKRVCSFCCCFCVSVFECVCVELRLRGIFESVGVKRCLCNSNAVLYEASSAQIESSVVMVRWSSFSDSRLSARSRSFSLRV